MREPGIIKRWFVIAVWKLTPNCAEITRMASESMERPLSLKRRIQVRIHFLICAFCERYFKHLEHIHQAAALYGKTVGDVSDQSLSAESKEHIKRALRESGK